MKTHPESSSYSWMLATLLLLVLSTRCRALKLLDMKVERYVELHSFVTLECLFDLEGLNLYSVKWYKDELEFFRYIPDNNPPSEAIPVAGISLDLTLSDMNQVTLNQVTFNTSGNYRCEVSTEAPNFSTVFDNRDMMVVAFPKEKPMIEGIVSSYSIGDYVTGNCTSGRSYPRSNLTWFINEIKVERWLLEYYAPEIPDEMGLSSRTLGLRFQVQRDHFAGDGGSMELRCTASLMDREWDRVVRPSIARLTNQKLAQERLGNRAPLTTSPEDIGLVLLVTVLKVISS